MGQLGHGSVGIAQDHPAGVVDPLLLVNRLVVQLHLQPHFVRRHIVGLHDVVAAPDPDITIHLLHPRQIKPGPLLQVFLVGAEQQRPGQRVIVQLHVGIASRRVNLRHQGPGQFVAGIKHFDQNLVALLYLARVMDQQLGQFYNSRIAHHQTPL